MRRTAVADEIGAEFTVRCPSEWHVVAQDLDLFPVLDNCCECAVRGSWLDGIVQFDVRQLRATRKIAARVSGAATGWRRSAGCVRPRAPYRFGRHLDVKSRGASTQ